jgi:hypothetical protein
MKRLKRLSWRVFVPSPGSILFTLLALTIFFWAQRVDAFGLHVPASVPASTNVIPYQGRLANTSGAPLNGSYPMAFSLYNVASGGSPLWTESWSGPNSVSVNDGLFNVMLGSLTSLPINIVTGNGSLWLGITVNTDNEMVPRVQLGSMPYAVQALTVPDGSITTAKITDGSVGTSDVANGAISRVKLASDVQLTLVQSGEVNGDTTTPGWGLGQGSGTRAYTFHVTFATTYAIPPTVQISITHMDMDTVPNSRLETYAANVTSQGFDLVFRTWSDSKVGGAGATWIAIGSQ